MTKCERYVCDWVYDFVNNNWDKIDHPKCELEQTTKEKFLKDVKSKPQDAMWVLTEVMDWAMDKNYREEITIFPKPNQDIDVDFKVIKLGDKYIKWVWNFDYGYTMTFTEPKTKTITVEYFE